MNVGGANGLEFLRRKRKLMELLDAYEQMSNHPFK